MNRFGSIRWCRSCRRLPSSRRGRHASGWLAGTLLLGVFAVPAAAQSDDVRTDEAQAAPKKPQDDAESDRSSRARRTIARMADWSRMSAQEQAEFEAFIKNQLPDVSAELELDKIRPRVYRQHMERLAPKIVPLMDQLDTNPERAELSLREMRAEYRIQALVSEYLQLENRGGNPDRLAALEVDIEKQVAERFDVRQKRRKLDIESLEERISFMRKLLDEKYENRVRIINKETKALLNPSAALDGEPDDDDSGSAKD